MALHITTSLLTIVLLFVSIKDAKSAHSNATNLDTLQLVQILFRHGDRTPTRSYPNDPYKDFEKFWPQGVGQLTDIGKIQHFNLGKYFRARYDGFLSRTYVPNEIHVLVSDMDRTIMSAEVNLAGLYEPVDSEKNWNPTIPWTPIPIRTIPRKEDKLLRATKPCPKYYQLYNDLMESEKVKQMNEENHDFVQYILDNTGESGNKIRDIAGIEDVLLIDHIHNYKLPGWVNQTIMEKFHALAAQHYLLATSTTELKRLKGGPLWKAFLKNMRNTVRGAWMDEVKPKMYMYSAHDSTLTRLMNTIGVSDGIMPTYAAAFIVELHKRDAERDYHVQMFYRNESSAAPYTLEVPGCPDPCFLDKLTQITAPVVPDDWEAECQEEILTSGTLATPSDDSVALTQAFLVCGSLFVSLSILLYITRKKINFELFTYRMPLPPRRHYPQGYETI